MAATTTSVPIAVATTTPQPTKQQQQPSDRAQTIRAIGDCLATLLSAIFQGISIIMKSKQQRKQSTVVIPKNGEDDDGDGRPEIIY